MPKKTPKLDEFQTKIDELTADLQRTRADFENYRKRVDIEKSQAREHGKTDAVLKLLPVIDNIERAVSHLPDELKQNQWALGVVNLAKNLDKSLEGMGLRRINASPGTEFDPELHEAIQMEDGDGEREVIAEELQSGYLLDGVVVRHSMAKVTRQ